MKPFDYAANKHLMVDSTGRRLTAGLFKELSDPAAVFSLADWRRIYIEVADPTEYRAAMALIGDWEHWLLLQSSKPFLAALEEWRREVEVKLRSDAIVELVKQSQGSKGTVAAKWLAEAGFAPRDKRNKKQRDEDDVVTREAKSKVAADAERLGLTLVKR